MKVLIACEESQEVCKAFRALGHEAYSCDIQECSGGHPEWHIQGDALQILNPCYVEFPCGGNIYDMDGELGIEFNTADGAYHFVAGRWDMIIAHPPCTYLTVSGNRWFNVERYGNKAKKRIEDREEAVSFFMKFANADCNNIAIENPIGHMSKRYKKPTQIVQPYMFGDPVRKPTCLWLKGLRPLVPTNIVEPEIISDGRTTYSGAAYYAKDENGKILSWNDPRTAKARSKTFPGIARAMAEQWGERVQTESL